MGGTAKLNFRPYVRINVTLWLRCQMAIRVWAGVFYFSKITEGVKRMKNFMYSKETDSKWQKKWKETELYKFDESQIGKKYYLLEQFAYPSAKNLHIGHWWIYGLSDSFGRFKRMQGYQVFHPPGFDAFGLPAENYAIKTGIHPKDSTEESIATMTEQFRAMGTTYDWNYEVVTCSEGYYKWTQWLFLKFYEKGLAYRKEAPVNWCPSCLTVLANEQAANGICERCDSEVIRRSMTQWFFKITEYADELLSALDTLNWPESTKTIQRNWIGKSHGTEVDFLLGEEKITVFTTRVDTLMGATYIVLAPEHPLVKQLTTVENEAAVYTYCQQAAHKSEIERADTKEKTGVFTGSFAQHPISGEPIPVWVADYVLYNYGTGAVMAVPAHDQRDYDFAIKFHLPITQVIACNTETSLPFCDDGILVNCGSFTGLTSEQGRQKITAFLESAQKGESKVKYRLRDWLVSRQRYWGTPIPIIHCNSCGIVPVPEGDLPVQLPYNVQFLPTGQSPLSACAEFINTVCPSCKKPAIRDIDTLDTFVCSSWYFMRYFDNRNKDVPFDKHRLESIMPVDMYVGGVEHATMHLLYARFFTKALRDMGYLNFDEPFPTLFHQGIISGQDGKKISKRDGAISPDVYINQYGSDIFRMYLCFGFSYADGGPWDENGIRAISRFVAKLSRLTENFATLKPEKQETEYNPDPELEYVRNYTVKQVTKDLELFRFNSAMARIMEFVNGISTYQKSSMRNHVYEQTFIKDLIILLAPFAPHLSEELWEYIGCHYSVHSQRFPVCDDTKLMRDIMNIAIQVNGRLRDVMALPTDMNEEDIKKAALAWERIQSYISGCEIVKVIYVKDRLVNIVCE